MAQRLQPVLGDVFAVADVLTPEVRLRLASLLAVPGRPQAILPGELNTLPLPADPAVGAAMGKAIESGLHPGPLAALAARRLDTLVPVLQGRDDDAIAGFVPASSRRPLLEHADGTPVAALTIGQISTWPGFGPRRVAAIVAAAVAAGRDLVGPGDDVRAATTATVDDLVTVLAHDAETGGELRRHLNEIAGSGSPELRLAAARILAVPASGAERCVAFLDEALAAAGDERDRAVFEHGGLTLGPPLTRAEMAAALGIGLERLRQLIVRAVERVEAALDEAPATVRRLAALAGERLGAAAPDDAVDEVLASLELPPLPDTRSRLLVRMAGSYRAVAGHPGWIALDPAELIAETRRMLHEDGGVRVGEHVAKELQTLGVATRHVDAWLARQPVRVGDGLVVLTTGSPADVAERVLHVCGRPLSIDELATWVPGGWDRTEVLWSIRDRRFVVTDDDALALVEWGETAGDDAIVARPSGERHGTLRIEVDRDVLGGHSGPVPLSLAHALGIGRGSRRTFSTRYGPVALAYDAEAPTRGSIRPVALAMGAAIGDELAITLYPDGNEADVSLVRSTRPDPAAA